MADWPYKLYAIMSEEAVAACKGNRGKLIAQGGHAYVGTLIKSAMIPEFGEAFETYMSLDGNNGFVKICLIAPEETLIALEAKYCAVCGTSLITDRGLTVFDKPTITALGLGPIAAEDIGDDLNKLKVFI